MAVHGGNTEEIARKYKLNPSEIIDFSANINPLGISENVKKAMIDAIDKVVKYPDITYFDLKNSIGEFEKINTRNITLGNGAAEVIFNIVRALKPKKALLPAPTFSEYEEAILSIDGEIEYYNLKESKNFNLDNEFIKKVLNKSILTNTIVVIDESFLDFVKDNKEYSSNKLLNDYENLIIVKSLTKFFAIPGARIGYGLCSNKEIMDKINKILVPWSINVIAAEGITKGLTEEQYIKKSIEYIEDEKEYLYSALKQIKYLYVFEPSVNFIMFKILTNLDLKGELIKRKILVRSCDNYIGLDNSFYRVAVRTREENNKLIAELKHILFDK